MLRPMCCLRIIADRTNDPQTGTPPFIFTARIINDVTAEIDNDITAINNNDPLIRTLRVLMVSPM